MKEQADIKNASGHFFEGRPKRLTIILAVILIILLIALLLFLYFHKVREQDKQNLADTNSNPGTITAVDDKSPTSEDSEKIDGTPVEKSANDYFNEGQALMSAQSWQQAVESFNQAINVDPKAPNYYNRKSQAQYNLGQKNQAIDTLEAGLAANPDSDLLRSRLDVLQKDYVGSQPQ